MFKKDMHKVDLEFTIKVKVGGYTDTNLKNAVNDVAADLVDNLECGGFVDSIKFESIKWVKDGEEEDVLMYLEE